MKKRPDKYDIVIAICAAVLIAVGAILISERVSGMKADRAQNAAKQLMEQGMQAAH